MPDLPEYTLRLVGWIWDIVSGFFVKQFEAVWAGFIAMVKPAIKEATEEFSSMTSDTTDKMWANLLETMAYLWDIPADDLKENFPRFNVPFPGDMILMMCVLLGTLTTYMTNAVTVLGQGANQSLLSKFPNSLPGIETLIQAAFVAPELTNEIRDQLRRYGFNDDAIDKHFIARYRLYNEEVIRVLYLRKVLTDDEMFMRMRELGYTDTRIREIIQAWDIIPGPQDLFHLVAKEAFEPDAISLMGLADEFPEDQVEWLQKQGISKDWALKYWYAHWEQPSIQMGFEMLHRGIIGLEELDMLFRTVEIPPFWRDKLTAIAYSPYTRVDVRRMHDMGVIGDEELIKAYKDLGYDDDHAYNMALFTVRYNRQNDRDLTKSQILNSFVEGLITRQDCVELIEGLGYSNDQAEYIVTYEEYVRDKQYQDDLIAIIGDKFMNNLISEIEMRNQLGQLNLPSVQSNLLIEKWKLKQIKDRKIPSKTDLDKFYRNKVITEDEYNMEMLRLGYGWTYIEWYKKLIDMKKAG